MELYTLHQGRGGHCGKLEELNGKHEAKAKMGTKEGMDIFKAYVRYIAENCMREDERVFFQAAKAKTWRLRFVF